MQLDPRLCSDLFPSYLDYLSECPVRTAFSWTMVNDHCLPDCKRYHQCCFDHWHWCAVLCLHCLPCHCCGTRAIAFRYGSNHSNYSLSWTETVSWRWLIRNRVCLRISIEANAALFWLNLADLFRAAVKDSSSHCYQMFLANLTSQIIWGLIGRVLSKLTSKESCRGLNQRVSSIGDRFRL